jgi:hypothetical protein
LISLAAADMFQPKLTRGHLNGKDNSVKPLLILLGRTGCMVFGLLMCNSACAQYSIDWSAIAGGGGTSTGGVYTISGTIGQPDAGAAMNGGNYSLTGGFWSLIAAVQTPGAPTLSVTNSGSSVIVSWPYPSSGYVLQQSATLTQGSWFGSGYTVSTNGGVNSISITSPTGNLFFRLVK